MIKRDSGYDFAHRKYFVCLHLPMFTLLESYLKIQKISTVLSNLVMQLSFKHLRLNLI